jgi:glycosyltransferase involved in cell wall biosynthesis
MNLLIINFEMNSNSKVLAWQIKVARALAVNFDRVTVFTHIYSGERLPENMEVVLFPSLFLKAPMRFIGGRWLTVLFLLPHFFKNHFNVCFIHMNHTWSYRFSPLFKLFRIPVLLWYAHGTVTNKLRLSHYFVDSVITSTPEGFRIPSRKVQVIGQSIDTNLFSFVPSVVASNTILYVGRISERKRINLLIHTIHQIVNVRGINIVLLILGDALTEDDKTYLTSLKELVNDYSLKDNVRFQGFVAMNEIPAYYSSAFLHVNVSQTGSMDKTMIEALSCGCPVLTSNSAMKNLLSNDPKCLITDEKPSEIAAKVIHFYQNQHTIERQKFRDLVLNKHDFLGYINKLSTILKRMTKSGKDFINN